MVARVHPRAADESQTTSLLDGTTIQLRRIRSDDKRLLKDAMRRLSPRSRYHRFARSFRELSDKDLNYLTNVDNASHVAWVAVDTIEHGARILGEVRYILAERDPAVAEVAVTVVDSHQGRGLGMLLLGRLAESARLNGVDRFLAYVCCENIPILRLARQFGAGVRFLGSGMMLVSGAIPQSFERVTQASY